MQLFSMTSNIRQPTALTDFGLFNVDNVVAKAEGYFIVIGYWLLVSTKITNYQLLIV